MEPEVRELGFHVGLLGLSIVFWAGFAAILILTLARFGSRAAREPARAGSIRHRAKTLARLISIFQRATNEPMLVFCNVTNKIRKRTDTAVAFTQEYSRVSYPLGNVSALSTGSNSPRTHTLV